MGNLRHLTLLACLVTGLGCNKAPTPSDRDDVPEDSVSSSSSLTITRLRWDTSSLPLGNVRLDPRLDWQLVSTERGQRQTAYQVLVASDQAKLAPGRADVWDSGKIVASDSINVVFAGRDLQGRDRGFWTVRAWDSADRASDFAVPAQWEMGPWDEEIEGHWVGRAKRPGEQAAEVGRAVTYLRRSFTVPAGFKEARLYATAFGLYEMSINGQRVGADVLSPGYTDYTKRVLLQARDVTALMRAGENVIGGILSGGWCTLRAGTAPALCGSDPPRLRATLEVTRADGSRQTLESDDEWQHATGPLLSAELVQGESYDARREMPGWNAPGFDASSWKPAVQYDEGIERNVLTDPGVPMRVNEDVPALTVSEPSAGVYVFDLGRSIVGWPRLLLEAPAGTDVTLRYARSLQQGGTLAPDATAKPVVDHYIARGGGLESWEPRFSLREFRYVELRGLVAAPPVSAIMGRVVHSEMPQTGTLETSNALVNRLFVEIASAQRSAFLSVPSFGTERTQRQGSLLEAQTFALTACLNRDVQGFYRKWIDDIRDAQLPTMAYAQLAPAPSARSGGAGAGLGGILVPWAMHRCYADRSLLDSHITSMGQFLEHIREKNPNLVWRRELGADLGDPGESGVGTDHALLATAELSYAAAALAQMMHGSGPSLQSAAERYARLSEDVRAAFVEEFVLPDGRLTSDTQTAYATAIARGVLVGRARELAGQHLAAAVERAGKRSTTGVLGSALLLPALSLVGQDELAYALLLGFAEAGTATPAVGEWIYDAVGGIALDPAAPAGRHVLVRPKPGGGLTHARTTYASLYGPIEVAWTLHGRVFRLKVSLPVGSSATVTMPFAGAVSEGGNALASAPGLEVVTSGSSTTVVSLGSGTYELSVERP